jgi:hypothetical protein
MATPEQIAANRSNATHSTGPRTDAGRARSSQNALRHGLTAVRVLIPGENEEEFLLLRDAVHESMEPRSGLEAEIMNRLIVYLWRLRRTAELEAGLLTDLTLIALEKDAMTQYAAAKKREENEAAGERAKHDSPEAAQAGIELKKIHNDRKVPHVYLGAKLASDTEGLARLSRYEGEIFRRVERTLIELERVRNMTDGLAPPPALEVRVSNDD